MCTLDTGRTLLPPQKNNNKETNKYWKWLKPVIFVLVLGVTGILIKLFVDLCLKYYRKRREKKAKKLIEGLISEIFLNVMFKYRK